MNPPSVPTIVATVKTQIVLMKDGVSLEKAPATELELATATAIKAAKKIKAPAMV